MSKISSLGQSMAALFRPDSDAKRLSADKANGGALSKNKIEAVRNPQGTVASSSPDKDGNPQSPGYEPWGKKKKSSQAEEPHAPFKAIVVESSKNNTTLEVPGSGGNQLIRLQFGWDKILVAQKKLCEKARKLFTAQEAPESYHSQKGAKAKGGMKSRGCVVDLDIEALRIQREIEEKLKKSAG